MRTISFSKKLKVGLTLTTNIRSLSLTIFRREGSGRIQLWSILFPSKGNTTAHGHRSLKPRIECQSLNSLPFEAQLMLVRLHPNLASLFNISLDFKSPNLCLYKLCPPTSFKR